MLLMIWGTRISQILQYLLHFTQAEIAAQKKKGLTPIKKVCLNSSWFWRLNDCRGNEWFYIIFQPEVPLFGPHDTSRVSESDPPQISADGKLHARVCFASLKR